jgi:hypothetical protein
MISRVLLLSKFDMRLPMLEYWITLPGPPEGVDIGLKAPFGPSSTGGRYLNDQKNGAANLPFLLTAGNRLINLSVEFLPFVVWGPYHIVGH